MWLFIGSPLPLRVSGEASYIPPKISFIAKSSNLVSFLLLSYFIKDGLDNEDLLVVLDLENTFT